MKIKVAALVGPTAVGKTRISVRVARRLGAEIVSVDSMQVYRGMDVGTDKATAELRGALPHHLLDLLDPSEPLSVADFQRRARAALEDIARRGRVPFLVGGSGLYFRAVVDDLNFPPRSPLVRESLELEAERVGAQALHARLALVDPAAASRIEPSNARRTIRALEVVHVTGRRFSENDAWERYESVYDLAVAGLALPRPELHRRIDERVERMLEGGLIEEARRLEGRLGVTARQALGYKQILDSPRHSSKDALRAPIARATKRFARRQESWFRADPRIAWFDAADPRLEDELLTFFGSSLSAAERTSRPQPA